MVRSRNSFHYFDDRAQSFALCAIGRVHHVPHGRFDHEDLGLRIPLSVRIDVFGDVFREGAEPGAQYDHLRSAAMVGRRHFLSGIWSV